MTKKFIAFGDYVLCPDDIVWIKDYRKHPVSDFSGMSINLANGDVIDLDDDEVIYFWNAFCNYTGLYRGT